MAHAHIGIPWIAMLALTIALYIATFTYREVASNVPVLV